MVTSVPNLTLGFMLVTVAIGKPNVVLSQEALDEKDANKVGGKLAQNGSLSGSQHSGSLALETIRADGMCLEPVTWFEKNEVSSI